jgi:ATP-dependent helicase/nuclease subunit A
MNNASSMPEERIRLQAIDPSSSVWVSANAGSGKTTILTYRVISLLLNGVDPSRILCLTYTRAAAAEMQNRVFNDLGSWATLDDEKLRAAILKIEGTMPDAARLSFARRLFARAVETPGGLKIQTIHAFCERLLHLFPFESNVPARFRLMEETEQRDILEGCIASLQHSLVSGETSTLIDAITRVTSEAGEQGFPSLITDALKWRNAIADHAADAYNTQNERSSLAHMLELEPPETEEAITQQIAFDQGQDFETATHQYGSWETRLSGFNKTDYNLGVELDAAAKISDAKTRSEAYIEILLKQDLTIPVRLPTGKVEKNDPYLYNIIKNEQLRLVEFIEKRNSAHCLARTSALMSVADEVMTLYANAKRLRGLLDFDDVIRRTNLLLQRSTSAWVLYKLDGGIDHLLVDEAQDTSPEQWSILTKLTEEFFSGTGVRNTNRTVFAVGDEKQSIYSFQGAAPNAFAAQKKLFQARAQAIQQQFHPVELQLSFRSTGDILSAVDETFSHAANFKGLSGDDPKPTVHQTTRMGQAGLVEIWPCEEPSEAPEPDPHREVDATPISAPAVKLAKRIATRIAYWLTSGARFDDDGKLIGAGDIIILVRNRSSFFDAMIRALKAANVPVAGADRLKLTDHIAVMDLLAVAETALLPDDDLTLATVLKSPLIGLNDDDLIALCAMRDNIAPIGKELAPSRLVNGECPPALMRGIHDFDNSNIMPVKISLYQALAQNPHHQSAYQRIEHWRELARNCSPFHFFSTILGVDNGRKLILARLGQDAAEAIDVFLNDALSWQTKNMPSLFAFIHFMKSTGRQIKREFDTIPNAVRVMTVHASKGLEARIVFLGDTFSAPTGRKAPKLFKLQSEDSAQLRAEVFAWSQSKKLDPKAVAKARERWLESEHDEYRRLLYVGMTRARDRLYIGGFIGSTKPSDNAWFKTIETALGAGQYLQTIAAEDGSGDILQWRSVAQKHASPQKQSDDKREPFTIPDWLKIPLPIETVALPPLRPSSPLQAANRTDMNPQKMDDARRNGVLVHMLLQHLPNGYSIKHAALADRLLELKAADINTAERNAMRDMVLSLLEKSDIQALFGVNSRAEVEISGVIKAQPVLARIDRLCVTQTEVLVVDFKTGKAPLDKTHIPQPILRQLAVYKHLVQRIYPQKQVRAGVLWISTAQLVFASDDTLKDELQSIIS